MRMVTLIKLGTPQCEGTEITVPYNGDIFEFLEPHWRGLARRAACLPGGRLREDDRIAIVRAVELADVGVQS